LRFRRRDFQHRKQWSQQITKHRFHHHTQRHAGERDAELRRADVRIDTPDDMTRDLRATIAFGGE
jgi:hypothetical protein